MQQWEYKIIWNFPSDISDVTLGKLGLEGWELVAVSRKTGYFKRLLPKPIMSPAADFATLQAMNIF
jgi:hypothetical protein